MEDWRFSNKADGKNIDAVSSLIVRPERLWVPGGAYPDHQAYGDKTIDDVKAGRKIPMTAWRGSEEVGVGTYQRHPSDPSVVELRYFFVEPSARGRFVAHFLMRQILREALVDFPGTTTLQADAKLSDPSVIRFGIAQGFTVEAVTTLDDSQFAHNGEPDVVLSYDLTKTAKNRGADY